MVLSVGFPETPTVMNILVIQVRFDSHVETTYPSLSKQMFPHMFVNEFLYLRISRESESTPTMDGCSQLKMGQVANNATYQAEALWLFRCFYCCLTWWFLKI